MSYGIAFDEGDRVTFRNKHVQIFLLKNSPEGLGQRGKREQERIKRIVDFIKNSKVQIVGQVVCVRILKNGVFYTVDINNFTLIVPEGHLKKAKPLKDSA